MILLSIALLITPRTDSIGPINLTGKAPIITAEGIQAASGTNAPPPAVDWDRKGLWIWREDAGKSPVVTRFRKRFEVSRSQSRAIVTVSAEVSYRLWLNGNLVSRGPADTGKDYDFKAPGPWFDDIRDVSRFVHSGTNVLSAEVIPETLAGNQASSGHPGLKLDLHITAPGGATTAVRTDSSWRSSIAEDLADHNGPNGFRIDATREPVGWQSPSFDDSSWQQSVESQIERQTNLLSQLSSPLEAIIRPTGTERVTAGVKVFGNSGGAKFTQDGGYAIHYPRVMSGNMAITVRGHQGTRLLIMMNEPDAPGSNRRAEILLREGEQTLELPFLDGFSTINIEAKGVTRPVTIEEVWAIFQSYPVRYEGSFECDQPELNRIWTVSRWLTQICMQTHYLDSPDHQEPICDPGDYLIESLNGFYAFGDGTLARQDLQKFARILHQRDYQNFHTSYSLLWLQMLIQYYDYTGDKALVLELAPTVHGLLDKFESYIGGNGLISNAPNYMFMDWVEIEGFNIHHPPAVIGQGYMTAWFYEALSDDRRVAELQGDLSRAARDDQLRGQIHEAFNRELWVKREGLYRDGKPHQSTVAPHDWLPADKDIETFSTQVNALAVSTRLADRERSDVIMQKVLARKDMNCQPYFMHFVFQALAQTDLYDHYAVPQMNRWHVLPDSQSFFEMWDRGDRSHAWQCTPLFQLSGRILGVRPLEPGLKSFVVDIHPCGLKWAKGVVPTPHGKITISWTNHAGHLNVEFSVPKGTSAKCGKTKYGPGRHRVANANEFMLRS